MSADKQASFEFLASQGEWENECRTGNVAAIDKLPSEFRAAGARSWTFPAQLLATLQGYEKLDTLAKNGGRKKNEYDVKGYPAIVERLAFGGPGSPEQTWENFTAPTPACLEQLPDGSVLLSFKVRLQSPFYSRDDMAFYPTDNMLKRHKVFDAPYLAASGIKGLLRWAYAMARGSIKEDDIATQLFGKDGLSDDAWKAIMQYGAEQDNNSVGLQGSLYCYPLFWKGDVGLEVINAQHRETGSGTEPVKYEVVKAGGTGTLYFLLVNVPGRRPVTALVPHFLQALEYLLSFGGLSAKSSAGWGMVAVEQCNAAMCGLTLPKSPAIAAREAEEKAKKEAEARQAQEAAAKADEKKAEAIKALTDKNGAPLPWNDATHTKARLMALLDKTDSWVARMKKKELANLQAMVAEALQQAGDSPDQTASEPVAPPPPQAEEKSPAVATDWLWGKNGTADFAAFTQTLLAALADKEQK